MSSINLSPVDDIQQRLKALNEKSSYQSSFNPDVYRKISRIWKKHNISNFLLEAPFQNISEIAGCQNCYQAFQMDTYGEGCIHDCFYCFAKHTLEATHQWNNPLPKAADISRLWEIFYTVFETDKPSPWRSLLESKASLRIGGLSDSFMMMEKEYGISKEFLQILNHYQYPFFVVTKSPLIAEDQYLKLLDPKLSAVHLSLPSTNENALKIIEPHAPSAQKRLRTLSKLRQANIWTTVRINPLFPCYKDGHFSQENKDINEPVELDIFNFSMLDEIAQTGTKSVIAGLVHLEEKNIPANLPLKNKLFSMMKDPSSHQFLYSQEEVMCFYSEIQKYTHKLNMRFNTCYLGSGEANFFKYKKFHDNQNDCCDVISSVKEHTSTSKANINNFFHAEKQNNILTKLMTKLAIKIINYIHQKIGEQK